MIFDELTIESCGFVLEIDRISDEFGGIVLVFGRLGIG
jgi:hypothetical protein